jgi:hypothetical protein
MTPRVSHAIFGASDGMTSLIGVLAGLGVAHANPTTMLTTVGGLAVANGVSMASGDYLAGAGGRLAGVMGAATLIGSALPALPILIWPGRVGLFLALLLMLGMLGFIAEARYSSQQIEPSSRALSYSITLAIFTGTGVLAVFTTLALGAVGG